jgi:hypothetical protein
MGHPNIVGIYLPKLYRVLSEDMKELLKPYRIPEQAFAFACDLHGNILPQTSFRGMILSKEPVA